MLNQGPNHSLGTSKEGYVKPTKICSFEGCDKAALAKGLCQGHYQQQWKGQELRPLRSQITLEARFWQKVTRTPSCWVWTAATNSKGYGQIGVDGRVRRAHRVAWEMANGPIPDGMVLDHRCANPACVNPDHLRVVTNAQNLQHRIGANKNSASGIRGVYWIKDMNAWRAEARLNGRTYYAGYHSTLEAADAAARALRAQLFTHDDHHAWPHNKEKAS